MANSDSTPSRSEDELTAYHEAGHAVVARHLGLDIRRPSIVPGEGYAGSVGVEGGDGYLGPDDEGYDRWAELQGAVEYAGHAAVALVLKAAPYTDEAARAHGAGSDYDRAAGNLGNDARIASTKARAADLVVELADQIERVARALLVLRVLLDDEVQVLIDGDDLAEYLAMKALFMKKDL